jgi:hypothetical protein
VFPGLASFAIHRVELAFFAGLGGPLEFNSVSFFEGNWKLFCDECGAALPEPQNERFSQFR